MSTKPSYGLQINSKINVKRNHLKFVSIQEKPKRKYAKIYHLFLDDKNFKKTVIKTMSVSF